MLRVLLLVCLFLMQSTIASAQIEIDEIVARVDSLKKLQKDLVQQLGKVEEEISDLEGRLQEHAVKEQIDARGVVTTNMDASLRDDPMPGANVIRTIPQNVVLEALDFNGAYWKVRYKNTEGWVMRLFVDEGEGSDLIKREALSAASVRSGMPGQKELWKQERMGKTFLLTDFDLVTNTAGGVSINYAFEHLDSTRTMQEIVFSITPYNREGVIERGRNSGASTRRLRRFGPVSVYDGEQRFQFKNIWYNENIECAQIDRIDISYANGGRRSYSRDVDTLLSSQIDNDCTITAAERLDGEKGSVP